MPEVQKVEGQYEDLSDCKWFRLKAGGHEQDDLEAPYVKNAGGQVVLLNKSYKIGERFPSKTDLAEQHGRDKFEACAPRRSKRPTVQGQIEEEDTLDQLSTPPNPNLPKGCNDLTVEELRAMSINELKDYAKGQNIPLDKAKSKEDIIHKILACTPTPEDD